MSFFLTEHDYPALAASLGVSTYVHRGYEVPPYYNFGELSPVAFYLRGTRTYVGTKGAMQTAVWCSRVPPEDRHLVLAGAFMHDIGTGPRHEGLPGLYGATHRDTIPRAEAEVRQLFDAREWPRWHHASVALPDGVDCLAPLFGDSRGPFALHDHALEDHELRALLGFVVADVLARFELRSVHWEGAGND